MKPDKEDLIRTAIRLSSGMPGGALGQSTEVSPLAHGGSDRYFYRLRDEERSLIALVQPGGGNEFDRYISIGEFLRKNEIGVPEFYGIDLDRGVVLMEDLGEVHLEDALKGLTPGEELSLYKNCIDILVRLETVVTTEMERCLILEERLFDEETLLGETEYFMREFIDGYCKITCPAGWERERKYLAKILASEPRVFMHRDFQSRNMILKNAEIRIIDFQTAYRGPGLYDAAALLKDPYHPLSADNRRTLLLLLYEGLSDRGGAVPESFDEFQETFIAAGLQRNLQALAAFARLGLKKGKNKFLGYIPSGLDLLEEGIEESGNFPSLGTMVGEIKDRIGKGQG